MALLTSSMVLSYQASRGLSTAIRFVECELVSRRDPLGTVVQTVSISACGRVYGPVLGVKGFIRPSVVPLDQA